LGCKAEAKLKVASLFLCNDPHLALSLPSIWYEMAFGIAKYECVRCNTCQVHRRLLLALLNDSISWGVTNGGRDVRDWYKVKFKDDTRSEI